MLNITELLKSSSIRQRLMIWLIGPMALLLLVSLASDYRIANRRSENAFDSLLADSALDIASHLHVDGTGRTWLDLSPQAQEVLRSDAFDEIHFLVWNSRQGWVAGTPDLPRPQATDSDQTTFFDTRYRGLKLRAVNHRVGSDENFTDVIVAETTHRRDKASRETVIAMIIPNLVLVASTLLLIYFGIRFSLRPLEHLRREIERRSPDDLGTLKLDAIPLEVKPVVSALNRLFELLVSASELQRRFLADAAHQLRTPLTAVQTQLDLLAMNTAQTPSPDHLRRIEAATARITRLVNQLLTLARSERAAHIGEPFRPVRLIEIAEAATSAFLDQAIAREVDLGLEGGSGQVEGIDWLIGEALANLLDNALSYTPAGGHVTVRCGVEGDDAFLEVEDTGPGIPEAEREHVVERFYRAPGSPGDGCGLGLSIVMEIVRLHGAELVIADGSGRQGARMRIVFRNRTHLPA